MIVVGAVPRCVLLALLGALFPSSASPAEPATAPAPPYVDRLIGGATEESVEESPAPSASDSLPGLRSWAAEVRGETRDLSATGRTSSGGVIARYAQETERYGDFALQLLGARTQPAAGQAGSGTLRGNATLLHENFALAPDVVAASALGVVRPILPPWLSTSYRVFLSAPLINGFSTVIASPERELRFSVGALGEYAGQVVPVFERIPGATAFATFSQRLPGEWLAGGMVIGVRGNDVVHDRSTLSLAAQQGFQQSAEGVKLQGAVTDDGERAAWIDAQERVGRLTHRFGAYHVDPDFGFGETQPLRDSRGAYWRGEYRAAGNFYGAGVELAEQNLRRDPQRGGNDAAGGYGTLVLRLDRTSQLGGELSARNERPRTPTGVARRVYAGYVFLSRNSALGTSRLDANGSLSRPSFGAEDRWQIYNWNQDWNFSEAISLSSLASYSDETANERRVKRRTLSLGARGAYRALNWDASVTLVDASGDQGDARNYNTALAIEWSPAREWMLQLGWFRNVIQPGPDNSLAPFRRENVVHLSLRYEDTAGTPFPRMGGAGRSGTGTITGAVFYDENGDGRRQATERGAAGVVVVLDERQSATTDSDGRYRFALVPVGRHRIRVLLERVALPWGLEEEAPREVAVDMRTDTRHDVGLTRVAP